jgi:hypothetical protein
MASTFARKIGRTITMGVLSGLRYGGIQRAMEQRNLAGDLRKDFWVPTKQRIRLIASSAWPLVATGWTLILCEF